jgi:hypothetical protein
MRMVLDTCRPLTCTINARASVNCWRQELPKGIAPPATMLVLVPDILYLTIPESIKQKTGVLSRRTFWMSCGRNS